MVKCCMVVDQNDRIILIVDTLPKSVDGSTIHTTRYLCLILNLPVDPTNLRDGLHVVTLH